MNYMRDHPYRDSQTGPQISGNSVSTNPLSLHLAASTASDLSAKLSCSCAKPGLARPRFGSND